MLNAMNPDGSVLGAHDSDGEVECNALFGPFQLP